MDKEYKTEIDRSVVEALAEHHKAARLGRALQVASVVMAVIAAILIGVELYA